MCIKRFNNVLKKLPLVGLLLLTSACKPVSEQGPSSIVSTVVPLCIDSQSQCEISTELARFSIKFSQHQLSDKVKTELPFTIELSQLQNNSEQRITQVSAYLEGKDMFMGKVPVFFDKTDNKSVYLAQSLLANCSEEQMIWRLRLTVEMVEQTQTFFVDFTSQRL